MPLHLHWERSLLCCFLYRLYLAISGFKISVKGWQLSGRAACFSGRWSCSVSDDEWTDLSLEVRNYGMLGICDARVSLLPFMEIATLRHLVFHHNRSCFVIHLWWWNQTFPFHLRIHQLRLKAKMFTSGLFLQSFQNVTGRAKTMKLRSAMFRTELNVSSPKPTHVMLSSTRPVPHNQLWHDMTIKWKKRKKQGSLSRIGNTVL